MRDWQNNSRNTGKWKSTKRNSCGKPTQLSAEISEEINANSLTCSTRAKSSKNKNSTKKRNSLKQLPKYSQQETESISATKKQNN